MYKFFVLVLLLSGLLSLNLPLFAQQSASESAEAALSQEEASQAQIQEKPESIFGFKMEGSNNQKSQDKQPISINADTVEYSVNSKDVLA
ncbi:MAG: hypothetical protein WBI28_04590, partial [Candidatus Omnitrophota bacterium]